MKAIEIKSEKYLIKGTPNIRDIDSFLKLNPQYEIFSGSISNTLQQKKGSLFKKSLVEKYFTYSSRRDLTDIKEEKFKSEGLINQLKFKDSSRLEFFKLIGNKGYIEIKVDFASDDIKTINTLIKHINSLTNEELKNHWFNLMSEYNSSLFEKKDLELNFKNDDYKALRIGLENNFFLLQETNQGIFESFPDIFPRYEFIYFKPKKISLPESISEFLNEFSENLD